jgi:hypothetical protein
MAEWKKVITSGSDVSQLNNDAGYLTVETLNVPNGFSSASFNGTHIIANTTTSSLNFVSESGEGLTINADAGTDTLTFGLSAIPNISLANSSIYLDGQSYSLGTTGSILEGSGVWSGSAQLPSGVVSSSDQIDGSVGNIDTTSFTGSFSGSFNGVFEGVTLNVGISGSSVGSLSLDLLSDFLILSQSDNNIIIVEVGDKIAFALSDSIFGDITFVNDVKIDENLTVDGDLIVNGDLTYLNVANLQVEDQFILLNSGSNTGDGGIVVQSGSQGKGELFGWDDSSRRWGFGHIFNATGSFGENAGNYISFAAEVFQGDTTTPASITYAPFNAAGNIFTGTDESIWIYS